uniref:Uncharacterized protein n=1 Tax=Anguilla anguilla TaxID=7936 RepID=A0A0E9R9X6_ANGAN
MLPYIFYIVTSPVRQHIRLNISREPGLIQS